MILPAWLDLAFGENVAARMFRGLQGPVVSWGEIIASAQATMGFYQEYPEGELTDLYAEPRARPLVAAARILDSASQPQSGIAEPERHHLGLLSAVAYSMYGNFPSATAVLRRIVTAGYQWTPALAVVIGTAAPELIGSSLRQCGHKSKARHYLEQVTQLLEQGDPRLYGPTLSALVACMLSADTPLESALLRSCRLALGHLATLSLARHLLDYSDFTPDGYLERLLASGIKCLLPPQFNAIVNRGILGSSNNTLITLPTSTGKTLLAELCLAVALKRLPGLVVYVCPYVELGRQTAQSFQKHFPEPLHVHRLMGGFRESDPLDPDDHPEVVVATPERFDAMLRTTPELLTRLRCVVFDEAHLIQSGSRGMRLEGIISRLRLVQRQGYGFRLILMSAVLSNEEEVLSWLGGNETLLIHDSWKPTARRLASWRSDGRLLWYYAGEKLRAPAARPESVLGEFFLPWPASRLYPTGTFGGMAKQEPMVHDNISYLVEVLLQRYNSPILCACATKDASRKVAYAVAKRLPRLSAMPPNVGRAIERIRRHHRFLLPLTELLEHGVAFHNASLPHDVRAHLFEAIAKRELFVVSATTTLAEGVDLPFRFTILVDWLTYQGESARTPMPSLLFSNIAGRCGRAGIYTEGDTVVFDNPLGELEFTGPNVRWAVQANTFLRDEPEPLSSPIERLVSGNDNEPELAELASQFMAAIPVAPTVDDLPATFAAVSFFAHRNGDVTSLRRILERIRTNLLDAASGALATAASPLQLTPFGVAANTSGFSPFSCREIRAFLSGAVEDVEIVSISTILLQKMGTLPEQSCSRLRKMFSGKSTRFCVKEEDLSQLIAAWLSGEELEQMFARLPFVQRSSRSPTIEEWLEGDKPGTTWDTTFDQFIDLVSSTFVGFLPWLMHACGRLSTIADGWSKDVDWLGWGAMMEFGVDSQWAVAARVANAPVERKAIALLGRSWPPEYQSSEDPLGLTYIRSPRSRHVIVEIVRQVLLATGGPESPLYDDVLTLWRWLWETAGLPSSEIIIP